MIKTLAFVSALFLQVALAAPAVAPKPSAQIIDVTDKRTFEQVSGSVQWHAVGSPGFLKIDGKGGTVQGMVHTDKDGAATGHFVVDMSPFKTGIDLRDKHMREKYLETAKWKDAFFDLDPWTPTTSESKFAGKLTLKGVSKQVFGTAVLRGRTMKADFEISLKDFPVGVPSHLGITVAEDVQVSVVIELPNNSIPVSK